MAKSADDKTIDALEKLAQVVFTFGRIDRITRHEDGKTLESDTDHTVMLSLMACSLASQFTKLDVGKVAQYALVHDFVEVYAGDTAHIAGNLSAQEKDIKKEKEYQSLLRLKKEFDTELPWITKTIEEYESLLTPEARFIKVLDKIVSKLSHATNGAIVLKERGIDHDQMLILIKNQEEDIAKTYGKDQPEALGIYRNVAERLLKTLIDQQKQEA